MTINGETFYVNPSQANATGCTDVAPDDRFTCQQQVCCAHLVAAGTASWFHGWLLGAKLRMRDAL